MASLNLDLPKVGDKRQEAGFSKIEAVPNPKGPSYFSRLPIEKQ